MSEIALTLLLSGWQCPPLPCAEVWYGEELVLVCLEGKPHAPITLPSDVCREIHPNLKELNNE
jgi:hypothetical protein